MILRLLFQTKCQTMSSLREMMRAWEESQRLMALTSGRQFLEEDCLKDKMDTCQQS